MRKNRVNWTQLERNLLRELAKKKISTYEIALRLGRDAETIRRQMVKLGIPRLSRGRALELNYFWKGGQKVDKSGYILVKCPGHPYLTASGYIREHRLIMEMILGRYLLPQEVVHHKDTNHKNNDPDNLILYPSNGEHLKQELTGKIPAWTSEGRASILRAVQRRHEKALQKPPKPPFDRRAWAKVRQRNAKGEFAPQLLVSNDSLSPR